MDHVATCIDLEDKEYSSRRTLFYGYWLSLHKCTVSLKRDDFTTVVWYILFKN